MSKLAFSPTEIVWFPTSSVAISTRFSWLQETTTTTTTRFRICSLDRFRISWLPTASKPAAHQSQTCSSRYLIRWRLPCLLHEQSWIGRGKTVKDEKEDFVLTLNCLRMEWCAEWWVPGLRTQSCLFQYWCCCRWRKNPAVPVLFAVCLERKYLPFPDPERRPEQQSRSESRLSESAHICIPNKSPKQPTRFYQQTARVVSTRRKKESWSAAGEWRRRSFVAGLPKNNRDTDWISTILRDEVQIVLH